MAANKLHESGLPFIEETLCNQLPEIGDDSFHEQYWKPARKAIFRACGRASKGKEPASK
jgi:hypothetical protein